jgi:hypothetical protein
MKRRLPWLFIKILLTAAALAWFFSAVPLPSLLDRLTGIRWRAVVSAFFVNSAWVVPCAFRWKGIARLCGYRLRLMDSVRYYIIGSFFNAFLPTGNGGDVVRGFRASREYGYSLGGMWGTILVERVLGLMVSLFLVVATGFILLSKTAMPRDVLVSAAALFAGMTAAGGFMLSREFRRLVRPVVQRIPLRPLREGARDAARVMEACRRNPRAMVSAVLWTLANQCIPVVSGFVLSFAIPDFKAPFAVFLLVVPLGFISMLLPSIGGYGVREAGTVLFFGWFGVGREPSAVFGIVRLLFLWIFSLIGGVLYIASRRDNGKTDWA